MYWRRPVFEVELTVLDACVDCDDEALYDILQNGVTWEQVNERDKSGRVSHSAAAHHTHNAHIFCRISGRAYMAE